MVDEGGYGERKEEKNDEENSTLKEGTVAAADAAAGYSAEGIAKIVEVLRANLDQSQDREEVEQEEKGVGNHHSVKTGLSFDGIEDKNTTNSGGASSGALSEFQFSKKSKKAMYALASVAKHEECVDHIVQSGGVSVLIEAIGRCVNAKNVSVSRAHNKQQMMNQQASSKVSLHKTAEYILKNACLVLGFVAMNRQHRKQVIEQGGVGALVHVLRCYSALCVQSQKGVGYASGLLSKQENNQVASGLSQIAQFDDTDAKKSFLSCLLVTQGSGDGRTPINTIARRAAGAVANLAHEDVHTKNLVREEGGIPALVLLLKAREFSVQVAAASTLKAISFRNEDNKNQIVECGALGSLVCMLRSSDPSIHYEAVAVMSSLVHSSAHIKKLVLNGGALQPLINLLSSKDMESRREAALLLGQFANVQDPDYKTKIVQRGALGPLIAMLSEESVQVSEMAAFAIGRLAQNKDNQAGIVQAGGLQPLLQLLSSKYLNSQHNAAFALYGLSDNDDNVPHFLKSGCVSILLSGKFEVQASKDCVRNTLRKLEERISQSHVLNHLKYLLSSEGTGMQTKYYIATGLAFLAPLAALYNIFMENHGMDVLFFNALNSHCVSCQKESIEAIHTLGKRTSAFSNLPTIEKGVKPGIYDATDKPFLGEFYLNNPTMSDVIFEVEGKIIYAHKIALLAASDQFCDMISASETRDNRSYIAYGDQGIGFSTLMKILSYVYSGHVHIKENDKAFDLLGQAEKLNLGGLKYACETFLMASIDAHSVSSIFDLAMRTNTTHLQKAAVWYSISEYSRLVLVHGAAQYTNMLSKMLDTFVRSL
jgi:HEAT repeat protein